MSEELSREEMLRQTYEAIKKANRPQYLDEVAMPGAYMPVNPKDADLPDDNSSKR